MPTDIAMFEKSEISVVIGQAGEEVKADATYTTDSSEEGFANAVKRYVLKNSQ